MISGRSPNCNVSHESPLDYPALAQIHYGIMRLTETGVNMKTKLGKLTVAHLRLVKACRPQIELFKTAFPNGFTPSYENFMRAADVGLDVAWALNEFISIRIKNEIFNRAYRRRWGTPYTNKTESYSHTVALCWWEAIKREIGE